MTQRRFILMVFLLATAGRLFVAFWHYQDMNVDEVVSAYEAFSLAETGRDRTGASWPLYFYNFGFGENVTYAYLLVPLFTFFGTLSFLTPIPSVVFNTLAVMMFYLWTRRLFSDSVARTAAVLLAISPWHLILTSYEYNVSLIPFLLFTGLWGFLVGVQDKKPWGLLVTMSCFVLAMYTYGIAMMLIPFELVVLLWFFRSEVKTFRVEFFLFILLGTALVLPLFLFMLTAEDGVVSLWPGSFPVLGWTRASMFIPLQTPFGLALLQTLHNITSIFSFKSLFWDLHFVIAPQNLSLLWIWEFPLILIGIIHAFSKRKDRPWRFLGAWSIIGLLPSFFMANEFHPHPWRLIFLLGVGEILAAVGWVAFQSQIRSRPIFQRASRVIFVLLIVGSSIFAMVRFTDGLPFDVYTFRQGGIAQTMERVLEESKDVDRIVMDDQLLRSYIFYIDVLWYHRVNPRIYQKIFQENHDPEPRYFVPRIGKIEFCYLERQCNIQSVYEENPRGLFVVWGDALPSVSDVAEIRHPDGSVIFRLIKNPPNEK